MRSWGWRSTSPSSCSSPRRSPPPRLQSWLWRQLESLCPPPGSWCLWSWSMIIDHGSWWCLRWWWWHDSIHVQSMPNPGSRPMLNQILGRWYRGWQRSRSTWRWSRSRWRRWWWPWCPWRVQGQDLCPGKEPLAAFCYLHTKVTSQICQKFCYLHNHNISDMSKTCEILNMDFIHSPPSSS